MRMGPHLLQCQSTNWKMALGTWRQNVDGFWGKRSFFPTTECPPSLMSFTYTELSLSCRQNYSATFCDYSVQFSDSAFYLLRQIRLACFNRPVLWTGAQNETTCDLTTNCWRQISSHVQFITAFCSAIPESVSPDSLFWMRLSAISWSPSRSPFWRLVHGNELSRDSE